MYRCAFTVLLLFAGTGLAQEPINLPEVAPPIPPPPPVGTAVRLPQGVMYVITSNAEFLVFASLDPLVGVEKVHGPITIMGRFVENPEVTQTKTYKEKNVAIVTAKGDGLCKLIIVPVGANKESQALQPILDCSMQPRPPPTPTPTPPTPTPTPPTPTPTPPGPVPIPGEGFRVLVVYETAELAKIPASQLSVLTSTEIRSYLNSKCATGPAGNKDYRFWDKDVDTSGDAKIWQDAMKRPRDSLPWIIISNGKDGTECPLPKTIPETMTLLKKYGGA